MDEDLDSLPREQLIVEARKLRAAIREHRDASGHDLCWHHPAMWSLLPDKTSPSILVPAWPQFMRGCIRYRQSLDEQASDVARTQDEFDKTGAARQHPVARAEMLIRRPVAQVFDAFVDPDTITKFWLDGTTGPLAPGSRVRWQFMVPGATETVAVTAFEERRRIAFDWSDGMRVDMTFEEGGDGATRINVQVEGFAQDAGVDEVVNATEGFTIVLCDLKTLVETGRSANLVRDKAALIARS